MRALLDTHSFIWSHTLDDRLSEHALQLIEDGANDLLLSAVTVWEIAIKYGLGRLPLPEAPGEYVQKRVAVQALTPLAIDFSHALAAGGLPNHHSDPFDRLLVAQAQVEAVPIITSDANIAQYDVEVIW